MAKQIIKASEMVNLVWGENSAHIEWKDFDASKFAVMRKMAGLNVQDLEECVDTENLELPELGRAGIKKLTRIRREIIRLDGEVVYDRNGNARRTEEEYFIYKVTTLRDSSARWSSVNTHHKDLTSLEAAGEMLLGWLDRRFRVIQLDAGFYARKAERDAKGMEMHANYVRENEVSHAERAVAEAKIQIESCEAELAEAKAELAKAEKKLATTSERIEAAEAKAKAARDEANKAAQVAA